MKKKDLNVLNFEGYKNASSEKKRQLAIELADELVKLVEESDEIEAIAFVFASKDEFTNRWMGSASLVNILVDRLKSDLLGWFTDA